MSVRKVYVRCVQGVRVRCVCVCEVCVWGLRPTLVNPTLANLNWPTLAKPAPKGGASKGGAPKGGRPKISRFFFPSRHRFVLIVSLLGVFSWNFGGVLKRRSPQMCTFWRAQTCTF